MQPTPRYVRCINNRAYIRYKDQPAPEYDLATLIVGQVYKVAPPEENDGDLLRVIDETGEDYLYPARYFEPFEPKTTAQVTTSVAAHLPPDLKHVLHAEALSAGKSVSALLREWIEDRLDLPVAA
jgi:hypothetical protein